MSHSLPLADCTRDTLQAMNRCANMNVSGSLINSAKLKRHNPYASKLLAQEDSVEFNSSILSSPLSARHSPLNWEAHAFDPSFMYSDASTPYVGQSFASLTIDAQVRRSLFGDSPAALAVNQLADTLGLDNGNINSVHKGVSSQNNAYLTLAAGKAVRSPAGGTKKAIGKIYAGGRPVVVPRYDNEVIVQLRSGEASFVVADIHSLLALEEETRDLVGLSVIVEGDRGEDLGVITALVRSDSATDASTPVKAEAEGEEEKEVVASSATVKSLPRVLRVASAAELQQNAALPQLEGEALAYCHACLAEAQLAVPIAVEGVVFQFDRKKLTVRYTSEAYVDFNNLTRMLHKKYNCRIWMDQLNRDVVSGVDKRGSCRGEHGGKKGSGNHQRKGQQKRKY